MCEIGVGGLSTRLWVQETVVEFLAGRLDARVWVRLGHLVVDFLHLILHVCRLAHQIRRVHVEVVRDIPARVLEVVLWVVLNLILLILLLLLLTLVLLLVVFVSELPIKCHPLEEGYRDLRLVVLVRVDGIDDVVAVRREDVLVLFEVDFSLRVVHLHLRSRVRHWHLAR